MPCRWKSDGKNPASLREKEITIDSDQIVSYDIVEIDFTTPDNKERKTCPQICSAVSGP